MDRAGLRSLTSQLAEDLAWLEEHARQQAGQELAASRLRLAAGMVRNVLGPWLEDRPTKPLHVAVVGGAGAGKSTLANMLCGGPVAESNPQAGFTRHPVAYVSATEGPVRWTDYLGFLGSLKRLSRPSPSNLDDDVFQVRRVGSESKDPSLLANLVVWDCPDMTTAAAAAYVTRLLEVASLADLILYVASDERYNDEVPTRFLKLLLEAGKKVLVCLVKVREADAAAFVDHFQKEVIGGFPVKPANILTIPQLGVDQLNDPVEKARPHRDRLVQEVRALTEPPEEARKKTVASAVHFLRAHQNDLQSVARHDLAALEAWRNLVQEGQVEFEQRYRREYLTTERFRRFDESISRILELLELPGPGKVVSGMLYVLRTPYRLTRGLWSLTMHRPFAPSLAEKPVLEAGLSAWLDLLRKEATRRREEHPLWAHVHKGFTAGLPELARDRFEQSWRSFQVSLGTEIEPSARRIPEELEQRPTLLALLRGAKIGLEALAVLATLFFFHFSLLGLFLIPVAVSLTEYLVELAVRFYVEAQREHVRARQQALLTQYLAGPLAEWLTTWPTTGGSIFERLHIALRRIGPAIGQLEAAASGK